MAYAFNNHHTYLGNWGVVNGAWNGGWGGATPDLLYNGSQIGVYQPGYAYPVDHPYHFGNHYYNGAPLGPYVPGYAYPSDHPYYHHHHFKHLYY